MLHRMLCIRTWRRTSGGPGRTSRSARCPCLHGTGIQPAARRLRHLVRMANLFGCSHNIAAAHESIAACGCRRALLLVGRSRGVAEHRRHVKVHRIVAIGVCPRVGSCGGSSAEGHASAQTYTILDVSIMHRLPAFSFAAAALSRSALNDDDAVTPTSRASIHPARARPRDSLYLHALRLTRSSCSPTPSSCSCALALGTHWHLARGRRS